MEPISVADATIEQLLTETGRVYAEKSTLTDEILSALNFVFQTPLLHALDLVDHRSVTRLTSPSHRTVYQVIGSSGTPYTCPISCNYCGCPAFKYAVLKRGGKYCKHLLAIRLSEVMGVLKEQEITDKELTSMFKVLD